MADEPSTDDPGPLLRSVELAACVAVAAIATAVAVTRLPLTAALVTGLLTLLMVLITVIDFRHFIIPDILSLPAIPLGIAANVIVFHPDDWTTGVSESLLGTVIAGGTFYLLRAGYQRLRGFEGLGLGDVKLAAVAGAWLGPEPLASACFVAALGGLAAVLVMAVLPGRKLAATDHIPFGSFIAPTILLFWVWRLLEAGGYWPAAG